MPLYEIGAQGYHQGQAVATLTQTPLTGRGNIITDLQVDKVSAADTWVLTCAGRELARFDLETTGNQQVLAGPYSGYPKNNNIFSLLKEKMGIVINYPVPEGQSITIASVGGATANIQFEFQEVMPTELSPGMINHPSGNRFIVPLYLYRNASVTTAGENALDSQIGPSWFPNMAVANNVPSGWNVNILAWFLEGQGRNTYSGSADHQSVTTYLKVERNGQILFTRDALGGIPLVGQASAAGSANTVTSSDATPFPAFQETSLSDWEQMIPTLQFGAGNNYQFILNISGDVTGGATYAAARQLLICDVRMNGAF
jgi:hypothetical protein